MAYKKKILKIDNTKRFKWYSRCKYFLCL